MASIDRERFLANMAADAERLSRLVRRLMELARADVTIGAQAGSVLASVADALAGRDFAVGLHLPKATTPLAIDSDALEAVLTIVGDNAQQAGASRLDIVLVMREDDACYDFVDDGPGIPQGDRIRIFVPSSPASAIGLGRGMGPAIARSLLEGYRGALQLLPSACGAHFRILGPVAPDIAA
ncbi:sensor histidine kinase [Sphingomonas sp. VDB2]|uniref:sensor histidine kinase n=1 Tax=Sphingomonas sp. VDB2 TaxID=3228751 RepID=UPI003A7FCA42